MHSCISVYLAPQEIGQCGSKTTKQVGQVGQVGQIAKVMLT